MDAEAHPLTVIINEHTRIQTQNDQRKSRHINMRISTQIIVHKHTSIQRTPNVEKDENKIRRWLNKYRCRRRSHSHQKKKYHHISMHQATIQSSRKRSVRLCVWSCECVCQCVCIVCMCMSVKEVGESKNRRLNVCVFIFANFSTQMIATFYSKMKKFSFIVFCLLLQTWLRNLRKWKMATIINELRL